MALADQIIGVESGGDPYARNPRSSAGGLGQFIDSTWLSMLAKHRPDLTGSPDELLALKTSPELSRQMTDAYAKDNGEILSKSGIPVTPGNTYLAHFAGPDGAVKVLGADPAMPVSSILGMGVVKANPFLANMTAGDLQAWAGKKMGGAAMPQPMAGVGQPPQMAQQAPPVAASFPAIAYGGSPNNAPAGFSGAPQSQPQALPQEQPPEMAMQAMQMLGGAPRRPPDFKRLMAKFNQARPTSRA